MENEDDWRAKRAAELIGTPFERPIEPMRDPMDETLPIQRSEPAVFTAAGGTAPPAPTGVFSDTDSAVSGVKKWSIAAAGLLAVLVAIIVSTLGRHRSPDPTIITASQPVAPVISLRPTATASIAARVSTSNSIDVPTMAPRVTDPVAAIAPQPTPGHGQSPAARPALVVARARTKPEALSANPRKEDLKRPVITLPIITISVPRCRPSSSRTDLAICASPTLTALDRQSRDLFALIVTDGDQRSIAKAQRSEASFLKKRDRCKDDGCLNKVYIHRIAALQKLRKKEVIAQAKAEERALPVCAKGQKPTVGVCRRRPLLNRLFG